MAPIETNVPPLPQELTQLALYLMRRDGGFPRGTVVPITIQTEPQLDNEGDPGPPVVLPGHELVIDTIIWEYKPGLNPADAFVVAHIIGPDDPVLDITDRSSVLVPAESRSHAFSWSKYTTRGYAVRSVRWTHSGPKYSAWATMAEWWNIEGEQPTP